MEDTVAFGVRYTSPSWLEQERTALWPHAWVAVAAATSVSAPGTVRVTSLGPFSVLLVRDGDALRQEIEARSQTH